MSIHWNNGPAAKDLYLNNGQRAIAAYFNNENSPVFIHQDAPTITGFGLTAGSGKQQNLDINLPDLPIDITMSATLANAESWEIRRNAGNASTIIAASPDNSSPPFHQERLTSSFRPNRNTWDYVLTATRTVAGIAYSAHAVAHLRILEAPRLDSFAADGPYSTGGGAGLHAEFLPHLDRLHGISDCSRIHAAERIPSRSPAFKQTSHFCRRAAAGKQSNSDFDNATDVASYNADA